MGRMPLGTGMGITAVAAAVMLALAGCGPTTRAPVPTYTPTGTATASPEASAEPETRTPVLRPGQSAAANLQFFDFVNQSTYDAQGRSIGVSIVNNLVDHGFVKADMEVTPDNTSLGIQSDSIIVSVRVQGECLVGQFGPGGYNSIVGPVLATGLCMVGMTRPIDW